MKEAGDELRPQVAVDVVETEDRILSDELRAALDELDLDSLFDAAD